jgi:hypothetical protein
MRVGRLVSCPDDRTFEVELTHFRMPFGSRILEGSGARIAGLSGDRRLCHSVPAGSVPEQRGALRDRRVPRIAALPKRDTWRTATDSWVTKDGHSRSNSTASVNERIFCVTYVPPAHVVLVDHRYTSLARW